MFHSVAGSRQQFRHIVRTLSSSTSETVFIALGSNLGNRSNNVHEALKALQKHVNITRTSFLYESKPMYKIDQPSFLNAAIKGVTTLPAHALLRELKTIEATLGRSGKGERNGPRTIDLDILTYGGHNMHDEVLTIPHPRIGERGFVLQPLYDIEPRLRIGEKSVEELLQRLVSTGDTDLVRVTPTKGARLLRWGERTLLMGIINATPDSFSDGGMYNTIDSAMTQVSRFVEAGFDIVDIGGQSTRPGAQYISPEQETERIIPIIESVHRAYPHMTISCDTFNATTAGLALDAGAGVVNDVTAGRDDDMFETVANTQAGVVLMHMRGDSGTMQSLVEYNNVVTDVATELSQRVEMALDRGIPRWSIITDPGIGFAKTGLQSVELVRGMGAFKALLGGYPTLLGLSRKSWLSGKDESLLTKDWKTAGAVGAAVGGGGVDAVRIHSADVSHAVRAADLVTGLAG